MEYSRNIGLLVSVALLGAAPLQAQWTTFHGNAQRDGVVNVSGPTTGNPDWATEIGGAIVSSPVVGSDGTIYLGSVLEDGLHPRCGVVAVHPNGTIKWRFPTGFSDHQVVSTPAIGADGTLYVGAQDGVFYAIHPDGTQRWAHRGVRPVRQHPVIAPDGTVYIGMDGRLLAFSPQGTLLWRSAQTDVHARGGPSLATDGTIYVAGGTFGAEAKMYAFQPNGSLSWTFNFPNAFFFPEAPAAVGPDGTIYSYTTALFAIRSNGTLKYETTLAFGDPHFGSVAVDAASNAYYAGRYDVSKVGPTGSVIWRRPIEVGPFLGASWSSPLIDADGRIYVGLGHSNRQGNSSEREIWALDGGTGAPVWTYTMPNITSSSAPGMGPDGTLYIGCFDGRLYAFQP